MSSRGKFMQLLETCLLLAEVDRVLCRLISCFIRLFALDRQMKYICCQKSSVIHGWRVYSVKVFAKEMLRLRKK